MSKIKPVITSLSLCLICALSGCSLGNNEKSKAALVESEITVQDVEKRKSLIELHKLATENVAGGQAKLAQEYYDGIYLKRDDSKALYWAQKAHDNKDSLGTLLLARMYFYGEGVDKDSAKAISLMESIVKERVEAGYILGNMYLKLADSENPEYAVKGAELISKSAENGFPVAQYEHARTMLISSQQSDPKLTPELKKSIQKNAVGFMYMAAYQDYIPAVRDMGLFFMNGYFVEKDIEKGEGLLEVASRQGDQVAINCLNKKECDLGVYK